MEEPQTAVSVFIGLISVVYWWLVASVSTPGRTLVVSTERSRGNSHKRDCALYGRMGNCYTVAQSEAMVMCGNDHWILCQTWPGQYKLIPGQGDQSPIWAKYWQLMAGRHFLWLPHAPFQCRKILRCFLNFNVEIDVLAKQGDGFPYRYISRDLCLLRPSAQVDHRRRIVAVNDFRVIQLLRSVLVVQVDKRALVSNNASVPELQN